MYSYYLKFAWRHLKKNLSYSVINIAGLSLGIGCVLLVFLYTQHELSYDTYHEKGDRIYRLVDYSPNFEAWSGIVEGNANEIMRQSYPEVEDAVTLGRACGREFTMEERELSGISPFCTGSGLFNIFSFDLLSGDPESVLDEPYSVVLSQSLADRLFPDRNPVGHTMQIDGGHLPDSETYTIRGVMEDIPEHTHFNANLLVSFSSMTEHGQGQAHYRYVLLREDANPEALADSALAYMQDVLGKSQETSDLKLQPLSDIYFGDISAPKQGNIDYIYLLSAIALVILLMACGNYLNLATARYAKRSREIGMRKVMGARREQLAGQFFFETILLSLAALPIALYLVQLSLPWFNSYIGTEVSLALWNNLWFYASLAGILGLTGLLAGSYPALVISAFNPIDALKGNRKMAFTASKLRKGLVSFQFLATIVMIGMTGVILSQLNYVQEKDLGFQTEDMIRLQVTDPALQAQAQALRDRLGGHAAIASAALGSTPGTTSFSGMQTGMEAVDGSGNNVTLQAPTVDEYFIGTMEINLVAGRNFRSQSTGSQIEVLVNETGIRALGFASPSAAVGQSLQNRFRIVGVVEDFHSESLHQDIQPVMMQHIPARPNYYLHAEILPGQESAALDHIRSVWKEAGVADNPQYTFLEDVFRQFYQQERQNARVIGVFSGLSILIACMGLFGLAAFIVEQRLKELGIRKVLGAGIKDIVLLLYRDFGMLLAFAALLGVPLIYYLGNQWLSNFAFHTQVGPLVLLVSVLSVALLTMLATGSRSLKAAFMNPVEVIRKQ